MFSRLWLSFFFFEMGEHKKNFLLFSFCSIFFFFFDTEEIIDTIVTIQVFREVHRPYLEMCKVLLFFIFFEKNFQCSVHHTNISTFSIILKYFHMTLQYNNGEKAFK